MSITLGRIKSFIAVADLGGFRKAAEELSVSQSAMSTHIRELEEELGVRLLRRTTRQVGLTEDGKLFLAKVRRTLDDFQSIINETREHATVARGRVSVAFVPSIAAGALPEILSGFARKHPEITVQISDERTELIEARLRRNDVDFAVCPSGGRDSDFEFEPVVNDPYFAIFPKTHALAREREITLARFSTFPLVLMRQGLNMRDVLDAAASRSGVQLRPQYEVCNHDTLTGIVAAGLGIGTMPRTTISMVHHPRLSMARLVEPEITRAIGILKRRGEPLQPAAKKLVDVILAHMLARTGDRPARRPAKALRK